MSILRTEVLPFKATAFKDGDFINISEADLHGKWSVVFFYPADFTFVCPTELEDLAEHALMPAPAVRTGCPPSATGSLSLTSAMCRLQSSSSTKCLTASSPRAMSRRH